MIGVTATSDLVVADDDGARFSFLITSTPPSTPATTRGNARRTIGFLFVAAGGCGCCVGVYCGICISCIGSGYGFDGVTCGGAASGSCIGGGCVVGRETGTLKSGP